MAKKMSKGAIIGISVGATIVVAGAVTAALVCTLHGKTVLRIEISKAKRRRDKLDSLDLRRTAYALAIAGAEKALKSDKFSNQDYLDMAKELKKLK